MKCAVYAIATVMVLLGTGTTMAQSLPSSDRLTPLQRQQFSRDLVPSSAQDFFRTGQANLEQEIRLLIGPRSPNKPLLNVNQDLQLQPEPNNQPPQLQRDRTQ
ncbi:hypothetical protein H6F76_04055 [Leptolyngbya sp. FACHB-321]|uniref:hypothetical protein n=1 Tax=Leptolyngbya sp. FACHB-321 TaxID=2692807 RepID=UPI001682E8B8|nr:hypothetical protein [Leptolyngbya sp. FACHB-321]MBD2034221.1 hypothetical protein [Leptolyngbya sp. FACHB-321]